MGDNTPRIPGGLMAGALGRRETEWPRWRNTSFCLQGLLEIGLQVPSDPAGRPFCVMDWALTADGKKQWMAGQSRPPRQSRSGGGRMLANGGL